MRRKLMLLIAVFMFLFVNRNYCNNSNDTFIIQCVPACGPNLFCNNGTCVNCIHDIDCGSQFFKCLTNDHGQPTCQFKSFFFYPNLWELTAFAICFVVAIIAATSGVGGGALFMPALIIIGGMPAMWAPIFSQVLIFGTMLMNFVYFFFQKAPVKKPPKEIEEKPQNKFSGAQSANFTPKSKSIGERIKEYIVDYIKWFFNNRPVVQFDCFCVLQPASLAGTILGVMLNAMLPDWCILAMLSCFSVYTASSSYKKGMNLRKKFIQNQKEMKKKKMEAQRRKDENYGTQTMQSGTTPTKLPKSPGGTGSDRAVSPYGDELIEEIMVPIPVEPTKLEKTLKTLLKIFEFDSNLNVPLHKLGFLFIGWVIVFVSAISRGSKRSKSIFDVQNCSVEWWAITLSLFPIFVGMSYAYAVVVMIKYYTMQAIEKRLTKLDEEKISKEELELQQAQAAADLKDGKKVPKKEYFQRVKEYDVDFSWRNTITIPIWGFVSGVVASMLGIGGGMVIVPVMNGFGVDPQVAASTSSSMIFSTSAATIIQFLLFKLLPWDYFFVLVIVASIGCFVGQFIIGSVVRKTGRTYLVLFVLVFMVVIALFLTIMQTFIAFYKSLFEGVYSGLSSPCA